MPGTPRPLTWRDDQTLLVDDLTFTLTTGNFDTFASSGQTFVLAKDRAFVEDYARVFAGESVDRVLEFGCFHGGSLLLMHKGFGAGKVVGIDLGKAQPALLQYLHAAGLTERIVAHFDTNQADESAVRTIIAQEFAGEPIDIVIDDASHAWALTRASFNLAFPYLKAGGLYIIEDWGWAHWKGAPWQEQLWIDQPALSNLVFELVMACTSSRETIARIDISPYFVAIRKGPAAVDPATFDLASLYVARGKHLTLI